METPATIDRLEQYRKGEPLTPEQCIELAEGLEAEALKLQVRVDVQDVQGKTRDKAVKAVLNFSEPAPELKEVTLTTEQVVDNLKIQQRGEKPFRPEKQIGALKAYAQLLRERAKMLQERQSQELPHRPEDDLKKMKEEPNKQDTPQEDPRLKILMERGATAEEIQAVLEGIPEEQESIDVDAPEELEPVIVDRGRSGNTEDAREGQYAVAA